MAKKATPRRIWAYRSIYLGLGLGVIFFRILPLETGAPGLPGPDIILAVTLAWILRQPAAVPVAAILFLFLLGDFLLQRPVGLWTLLALMSVVALQNRRTTLTEAPFLVEMAIVAGMILAMIVAERLILWVLLTDQPSLGLVLMEGLATIVIYPIVVFVSKFLLGMDKLSLVDLEAR
jgi:rod shape-determining protein MreD